MHLHFTIFTFSDVLNKAFFDWKKFKIKNIKILSLKSEDEEVRMFEISGDKIKWSEVPIYPECQTLDLSDYFDLSQITPLEIRFYIENNPDIGLGFFIEERNKVLKRRLSSFNILSYSGPDLESKNLSIGKDIKAVISLSQIKDLEEDTEKKCKNYPISGFENMNKTFEDYNACDLEFAYQKLKSVYQLTPFWATYNMSEVTASLQAQADMANRYGEQSANEKIVARMIVPNQVSAPYEKEKQKKLSAPRVQVGLQ